MAKTPIKTRQLAIAQKGHSIARDKIYPVLFGTTKDDLIVKNMAGSREDLEYGIDAVIFMKSTNLSFGIQERFRQYNQRYIKAYPQVTFTVWNNMSDRPSEWHKFKSVFMVYGYLNGDEETATSFETWIAVDIPRLQILYCRGEIVPVIPKVNDRNQSYFCFPYQELYNKGCVVASAGISFDKMINLGF